MITGVDQPRFGIAVFHFTFSVSLQCNGNPTGFLSVGAETYPSPHGPRNSGQSPLANCEPPTIITVTINENKLLPLRLWGRGGILLHNSGRLMPASCHTPAPLTSIGGASVLASRRPLRLPLDFGRSTPDLRCFLKKTF